jgi:acyl dehydratase
MNHHPVHLNVEFAKTSYHNKILVVGPLIISLSIGIASQDIDKYSLFCKSINFVKHTEPVFLGDTIEVESEILEKFEENGISYIKIQSKTLNQNNKYVLDLIRTLAFEKEKGDDYE